MSYYDILNDFYDLLQSNPLSSSAQLLYYTLLQINNKCGWIEWFQRTNINICGLTRINEKTLISSRNELKQVGLIDFIPSKKKGEITKYKILDCKINGSNDSKNKIGCKIDSSNDSLTDSVSDSLTTVETTVEPTDIKDLDIYKDKDKDVRGINTSIGAKAPTTTLSETPYQQIVDMYNSICISFKPVKTITDKRKQAIGARYRENDMNLDNFKISFELVQASSFLKGENSRNWMADFDWIMKPNNFVKVIEGKYENKQQTNYNTQATTGNKSKSFAEIAEEMEDIL